MEGNEFAHQQARALTYRATSTAEAKNQPLLTYREITTYYRHDRRTLPAPHAALTKEQQTIYRQIQTESFPHPRLLNRMFPNQFEEACPICKKLGTLQHMIGECRFSPKHPPPLPESRPTNPTLPFNERWRILLTSPALEDQLLLVTRGQAARAAYGFP